MPGNFSQPTEVVQRIIEIEKVPSLLADDPKPALAGNMDANHKNIHNVENIQVKYVNGVDIFDWIRNFVHKFKEYCDSTFSKVGHSHEINDVKELKNFVALAVDNGVSDRARIGHTHKAQDIQSMKEVVEFIVSEMDLAKEGHTHEEMRKRLDDMSSELAVKLAASDLSPFAEKVAEATKILAERIDILSSRISSEEEKTREASKPVAQKKRPEEIVTKVFVSEKILVPSACDGMRVVAMKATYFNGQHATFECSKSIGDKVKTDEVITIKSEIPCFFRIQFRDEQ